MLRLQEGRELQPHRQQLQLPCCPRSACSCAAEAAHHSTVARQVPQPGAHYCRGTAPAAFPSCSGRATSAAGAACSTRCMFLRPGFCTIKLKLFLD